jgi:hypothetical protein
MDFLLWFVKQLKNGLCPHCANPSTKVLVNGYSFYAKPCGCELYRVTIEPYKVVSLDEYRKAKNRYTRLIENDENFTMPFRLYCLFRTRYKYYLKAKKKQFIERKCLLSDH